MLTITTSVDDNSRAPKVLCPGPGFSLHGPASDEKVRDSVFVVFESILIKKFFSVDHENDRKLSLAIPQTIEVLQAKKIKVQPYILPREKSHIEMRPFIFLRKNS